MPTTIFVGNHGPRLSLGPGPLPAPVSPPPSDQALREAWDSFRERYVQSMLMHRDKKERMLAQYGWNSMQANEANEELVSFHTRIRADWHSRLRERGLDPTMGQDILDMKEKELLVQLIGEPAFRFRQGDGLGEIMVAPPLRYSMVPADQQQVDWSVQDAELGQGYTDIQETLNSMERTWATIERPASDVVQSSPSLPEFFMPAPQALQQPPRIPYDTRPTDSGPEPELCAHSLKSDDETRSRPTKRNALIRLLSLMRQTNYQRPSSQGRQLGSTLASCIPRIRGQLYLVLFLIALMKFFLRRK